MDTELLRHVGQIAGLGGLALGVLLLVFREVLRKNIFPDLARAHAYRIIRLIVVLTFAIAAVGIGAWVYVQTHAPSVPEVDFPTVDVNPVNNQYLKLIDAYQYSAAWNVMAAFARKRYPFELLKQAFETQRTPLGALVSRKLRNVGPVARLQDGTSGAFMQTEYATKFERSALTYIEDVYAIAEGGQWKIFAHTIRPCPTLECG